MKDSTEFGDVIHINHSKCGSESIVVFESRQAADAADQFLTDKGFRAIPGVAAILEAREKGEYNNAGGGTYYVLAGSGQVCFAAMHHKSEAPFCASDDVGGYMPNIETFVETLEGIIEVDTLENLKKEVNVLSELDANQNLS